MDNTCKQYYQPLVRKTCGERAMEHFPVFGVPGDSVGNGAPTM